MAASRKPRSTPSRLVLAGSLMLRRWPPARRRAPGGRHGGDPPLATRRQAGPDARAIADADADADADALRRAQGLIDPADRARRPVPSVSGVVVDPDPTSAPGGGPRAAGVRPTRLAQGTRTR